MSARARPAKRDLRLLDYQKEHNADMMAILRKNHIGFDSSDTGLGKTPNALALVAKADAQFITFGPASVEGVWAREIGKYKLPRYVGFISYETMGRGSAPVKVSRGGVAGEGQLIKKVKVATKSGKTTRTEYLVTDLFKKMLANPPRGAKGTFLIFDEVDALRNASNVNKVVGAFGRHIRANAPRGTRMIFMSATPADKEESAINFCRAMGYITMRTLTSGSGVNFKAEGLQELINACYKPHMQYQVEVQADSEGTDQEVKVDVLTPILDEYHWGTSSYKSTTMNKKLVFDLFVDVIMPGISSAMPSVGIPRMMYRGFFNISREVDRNRIEKAVLALQEIVRYDPETGEITGTRDRESKGKVFVELGEIEAGMVYDFCRMAHQDLKNRDEPYSKPMLVFHRNDSIDTALRYFRRYGIEPDVLAGTIEGVNTSPSKREPIIKEWNENKNRRLLLCNAKAMARGLSLHDVSKDKNGRGYQRRIMYIMPSYEMLVLHQGSGRIFRAGATSVGEAYFVFPANAPILTNMMDALMKKSGVTKSLLKQKNKGYVKFPGEHPRYIEPLAGIHPVSARTGEKLPSGGFIDESRIPWNIRGKKKLEQPIGLIIEWIKAGKPVPFMEQEILEPNWKMVKQMEDMAKDIDAIPPGTPGPSSAQAGSPSQAEIDDELDNLFGEGTSTRKPITVPDIDYSKDIDVDEPGDLGDLRGLGDSMSDLRIRSEEDDEEPIGVGRIRSDDEDEDFLGSSSAPRKAVHFRSDDSDIGEPEDEDDEDFLSESSSRVSRRASSEDIDDLSQF